MKQLLTAILLSLVFVSSRGEDAAKWADLDRYAAANDSIIAAAAYPRVVLMGNSITEMWPVRNPHLFTSNPDIVGRGISGQTSYQMLLRFSNDVIALHPKIAVISAGTNDIAENTGKYDEERTMPTSRLWPTLPAPTASSLFSPVYYLPEASSGDPTSRMPWRKYRASTGA